MINTGITACEQLKEVCFSGNVIPQIWFKTFVKKELKHPKPHLLSINILSDIVYWYRPTEIRDEGSGQLTGYKKKFAGDMLQRSYSQFADLFGCSCGQAKEAIVFLEKMGVVKRVFRDLVTNGVVCNNVLFIDLNVKRLKELTYPEKEKQPVKKVSAGVCRNFTGGVSESRQGCAEISPEGVSEFRQRGMVNSNGVASEFHRTNTETTTETISEINLSSPSYSPMPKNQRGRMEDAKPEVSKIISEIGLDNLKHKEMAEPVKAILSDMLLTGKVGRNQFRLNDVAAALCNLTTGEIDTVIDRFTVQGQKENINCPDDYLKACLLKAGRSVKLKQTVLTAEKHGSKPSYDIDEYVRLSMKRLHAE